MKRKLVREGSIDLVDQVSVFRGLKSVRVVGNVWHICFFAELGHTDNVVGGSRCKDADCGQHTEHWKPDDVDGEHTSAYVDARKLPVR